jgi:hypothetical protein
VSPFLEKLNDVLKAKWYPWVVLGVIGTLMIAYFIYAWTGHAPTNGPDHTNPWSDDRLPEKK